jgi:hypothetical protein
MKMKKALNALMLLFQALAFGLLIHSTPAQGTEPITPLDEKVAAFLDSRRDQWVDWNVSKALAPKLKVGGCYTAHNVLWRQNPGIRAFLDHVENLPHFQTTIIRGGGEGISLSYKKSDK